MNENLNLLEILKGCPKGTKFYSRFLGSVKFCKITLDNYIEVTGENGYYIGFKPNGTYLYSEENAEIDLFPSKDQRDWSKWHRPFVDGDILFYKHKSNNIKYTFIYKRRIDRHYLLQYCGWFSEKPYLSEQFNVKERMPLYENDNIRFATDEEKQELFDAIKSHGYKWNAESKTLGKLKK